MNLEYRTFDSSLLEDLSKFSSSVALDAHVSETVKEILSEIKLRGEDALLERTKLYDGAELTKSELAVKQSELTEALDSLKENQREALKEAMENISVFHQKSFPDDWRDNNLHGAMVGETYYPIKRVGIYVPGGNVPLVSTVLMTATLARVAKVPEVVVVTPPNTGGEIAPELLGALHLLNISEVYKAGGAQAIGALAYGTESIKPVDKIFGPGNSYVNEAKRQVYGTVGVDLLPGPSEVMVIADESAKAGFAAAALLAQAEHGSGKEKIYFLFTKQSFFEEVVREIEIQLETLSRRKAIEEVLEIGFKAVWIPELEKVAEVAEFVAPEHLELQVAEEKLDYLTENITTAGAILLGHASATALGDFVAGPSHVLPTGRSSRFSSGLRLQDFLRRTSLIKYDKESVKAASASASCFAEMERLDGHGRSVELRVDS